MSFSEELMETRGAVLKALAAAAASGDTQRAMSLGRDLEDLDRDYRLVVEIEERALRIKGELASSKNGANGANQRVINRTGGQRINGSQIRRQFAQTHGLQHIQGVLHRTTSGRSVAIATASEDPRRNRWWLGLPDITPDVVVLVCARGNRLLEFVIPQSALGPVWKRLSRDKSGNVKFNIKRSGGSYGDYELLVTDDSPMSVQSFLGQYAALN